MFPITITVHNAAQLNAVLHAMQPDLEASDFKHPEVGAAYVEAKTKVEANESAAAKGAALAPKSSAKAAPTPPTASAAPADAPEKKGEPSAPAADTVTYDQVKAAILDVSKAKGRDGALKLLAQFGAEKGPDLQKTPEKFEAFVAAAKALLS